MRLTLTLLWAHWKRHWLRTLLAMAAVATAVAMVIVVVGSGQATWSRAQAAGAQAAKALGRFELVVGTGGADDGASMRAGAAGAFATMAPAVVDHVRHSDQVAGVIECCQARVECRSSGPMFQTAMYRPGELMTCDLLATTSPQPPYKLLAGHWPADEQGVVVDAAVAYMAMGWQGGPGAMGGPGGRGGPAGHRSAPAMDECIGRTLTIASTTGRHEVRIVGVLDAPRTFARSSAIYVSPQMFASLTGQPAQTNFLWIDLRDGAADSEDFAEQLCDLAHKSGTPVRAQLAADFQAAAVRRGAMSRDTMGFFPLFRNAQMNLAILAAVFIIFSTFSMGLQERSRQLALLRAIGMTRGQVLWLVLAEAVLLAAAGWLVGVAAGRVMVQRANAGFDAAGQMGLWLGLGAAVAFGATLLAAAVPSVIALRRRPLESMAAMSGSASRPPRWLALGALLVAFNPLLASTSIFPEPLRSRVLLPLGVLAALAGMAMLIPAVLRACEGLFARVGGWMLGLSHRLLARQLSANLWRTVGCTAALMVGLGLYVTIQVWGQSMMAAFMVGQRSPDAVVTMFPGGIDEARLPQVASIGGVENCLPMILEHPAVADLPRGAGGMFFGPDVLYIGCDVRRMIDGRDGMIEASFVRGRADEALAMVERGGACLITASLHMRAPDSYDVGKTLTLDSIDQPRRKLTYTIAGVIDVPGWHLLTKSAQMRRGLGRVGAMVLVSEQTARQDYGQDDYRTFWFKLRDGAAADSLENTLIRIADPEARPATQPASMPARRGGPRSGGRGPSAASGPPPLDSSFYCRVIDTGAMSAAIRNRSEGIIAAMRLYPLLALGLASLAVVSTMMMSVRVRSWEIGVMRSLGLTRSQTLRLVLAQGLLIGLLACVMSLLFGLLASWVGIRVSCGAMGVHAGLIVPWPSVLLGVLGAVVMCVAGSLWPAIIAARRQPLRLLQEGRAVE